MIDQAVTELTTERARIAGIVWPSPLPCLEEDSAEAAESHGQATGAWPSCV